MNFIIYTINFPGFTILKELALCPRSCFLGPMREVLKPAPKRGDGGGVCTAPEAGPGFLPRLEGV